MSKLTCLSCLAVFLFTFASRAVCSYQTLINHFDVQPLPTDDSLPTLRTDMDDGLGCLYPTDCYDVQECGGNKSRVYRIFPFGMGEGFQAYCDMKTRSGGWLVFQRRQDGSVDFYRNWKSYTEGFGNLHGEFWLGLDKIHLLTSQRRYELLINLGSYDNGSRHAHYDRFYISDERHNFRILVGSYRGNAGDSLEYSNGYNFSTFDNDNEASSRNCAVHKHGAWWYNDCAWANLNGQHYFTTQKTKTDHESAYWWYWKKSNKPMQFIEMKLRPFL